MRNPIPSCIVCTAFAVAMAAGCGTIENARKTQDELSPLGKDDMVGTVTNRIDLSLYSLSQFVDFAMTNRPSIVKAALAVEDARLVLKSLRADAPLLSETPWLSPKLTLSGGYSAASESVPFDELGWKTEGGASAAVNLSIPIYDFGRHDAKVKSQCEKVLAAELELIDRGYDVFYEVADSYFSLLEKCALYAVAQTNEMEYAEHLEQAEKRMEAGEAKKLDVMRARLDLAQAREKTVAAQRSVDTSGAEFLKALGIDASHGSRRDVIDFPGDPLTFVMRGFPETDYTVKEAFDLARTNAPAMRLCRARLRGASHDVDAAIADLLPEITASASLNWTDPLWYWRWGVNGAQTLFQGFRKTTAVDRAVIALRQAAANLEEAELSLSLDIEQSVASRDTSRKARETAAASLHEAKDNLEMVHQEYLVGDVNRVEYTDAVAAYVTAMGNRVSAFYRGQRAECEIFALVGIYPVYEEKKLTEEFK